MIVINESVYGYFNVLHRNYDNTHFQEVETGCLSAEPIFIVGMPRTGTTLVEQILASHSQVFAAGELQNFPLQVKRLTNTPSADVLDLATLEAAAKLSAAELGNNYIESTRPRTGHTPRFIDKLPLNFVYLGLISCFSDLTPAAQGKMCHRLKEQKNFKLR